MEAFTFKAIDNAGNMIEDVKLAADEASLIRLLQDDGYLPISVTRQRSQAFNWFSKKTQGNGLSAKEVALFTKELATLLEAGLPLDRSLVVLKESLEEESAIAELIEQVLEKIKAGTTLADALESQSTAFSRFYLNMLRAGEAGGHVEDILKRLSDYLESAKELADTVKTALIYPSILVVMALASVFLLLTFVVPQFTEMFNSAGKELPVSTQIVVGTAEWLQSYWWFLMLLVVAAYNFMKQQMSDTQQREKWDTLFLKVPIVGEMLANMTVAAFSRTLGTLLLNGVPILTALTIAKETVANRVFVKILTEAEHDLKQGKNMSGVLLESGYFPKMAVQMIKIGEETGNLEEMLERTASVYDKQLKITVERLLTMMEPILIVTLGLVIAGIIISILSAILSVNDLAF